MIDCQDESNGGVMMCWECFEMTLAAQTAHEMSLRLYTYATDRSEALGGLKWPKSRSNGEIGASELRRARKSVDSQLRTRKSAKQSMRGPGEKRTREGGVAFVG